MAAFNIPKTPNSTHQNTCNLIFSVKFKKITKNYRVAWFHVQNARTKTARYLECDCVRSSFRLCLPPLSHSPIHRAMHRKTTEKYRIFQRFSNFQGLGKARFVHLLLTTRLLTFNWNHINPLSKDIYRARMKEFPVIEIVTVNGTFTRHFGVLVAPKTF